MKKVLLFEGTLLIISLGAVPVFVTIAQVVAGVVRLERSGRCYLLHLFITHIVFNHTIIIQHQAILKDMTLRFVHLAGTPELAVLYSDGSATTSTKPLALA